jgi:hypothetical protein
MRHPHFGIEAVANSGVVLSGRALMSMVENTERKAAPPAALVIPSEVPPPFSSRGVCARRDAVEESLFDFATGLEL